jgi:hypothetical protein
MNPTDTTAAALAARALGRTSPADQQPTDYTNPEPCLACGWLFDRAASGIEIRRPRARKIDGYVCCGACETKARNANGSAR